MTIIDLEVEDDKGTRHLDSTIVDTGWDGFLTLPEVALHEFSAERIGRAEIILADGSQRICDVFQLHVIWDGERRLIEVDAAETAPLVGMSLLDGFVLNSDVVDGGQVTISRRGFRIETPRSPQLHQ